MTPSRHFCEHRNELAENLIEIAVRLSIAAAEMAQTAGNNQDPAFIKAKLAVEGLRDECENIQSELSRHRLQHGC